MQSLCGLANPTGGMPASDGGLRQDVVIAVAHAVKERVAADSELELGKLVIRDQSWRTRLSAPDIDIGAVRKRIWPICASLAPNFLAFLVLEPSASVENTGAAPDVECSWSVQVIVWGNGLVGKVQHTTAKFEARLQAPGGSFGGIGFRSLGCLRTSLRIALAPFVALTPIDYPGSPICDGVSALHWLRLLSVLDIRKIVFAGGQGKAIKARVMKACEGRQSQRQTGTPPVHPDAILQFWSKIMPLMGGFEYALPIVKFQNFRSPRTRAKIP